MAEINSDNLENALNSGQPAQGSVPQGEQPQAPAMSKEMEIGFHQGALNTLVNERNELVKMAQITEQIMQAHVKRLEELGVKINTGQPAQK
jgi:hypothetical protein